MKRKNAHPARMISGLRKRINSLSREASAVIQVGMPIIATASLGYAFCIDDMIQKDPVGAYLIYSPMCEYIFLSLALIVGGSLLLDLLDRYYKNK